MPRAMAASSAALASAPGVGRPSLPRWLSVRPVEKPTAPATIASRTSSPMRAISASVATSPASARSPIANTRTASCGTWHAMSMVWRRRSSTSMYSGKVSQPQVRPSASAVPGMSSTPSISAISRSRSATRHGAKPTPQLPIATVVAPWIDDGSISSSQLAWPS
jgi:hypothetical protein